MIDRTCEQCGSSFAVYPSDLAPGSDGVVMKYRYTVRIYHLEEQHFETLRAALSFFESRGRLGHVWRYDFSAIDDSGDAGLTDLELNVLEMGDCEGRDALIALIDGAVRAA